MKIFKSVSNSPKKSFTFQSKVNLVFSDSLMTFAIKVPGTEKIVKKTRFELHLVRGICVLRIEIEKQMSLIFENT